MSFKDLTTGQLMYGAYVYYGYTIKEISDHLGILYSTISRAIKWVELRESQMYDCKTWSCFRMSLLEPVPSSSGVLPVDYFNRKGLLVPFIRTPSSFNVLDCVDWIIVGPGPRIDNRFNSVTQMVRKMGLKIKVRPSHIPFSRT